MQALSLATYAGILTKDTTELILSKAYGGMLALARLMSAEALDENLQALVAGAAAAQAAAPAQEASSSGGDADGGGENEAEEEEEVGEEEAMAGLGALFG
jgi:ribosomal protein L12E/L44/L45/RPP1/RPP2